MKNDLQTVIEKHIKDITKKEYDKASNYVKYRELLENHLYNIKVACGIEKGKYSTNKGQNN